MTVTAYDLTGRTALVTGAASGIGRATAVLLAEAGAAVHCADRDEKGLRETAGRISSAGGSASAHVLDVGVRAQVADTVRTVAQTGGRLDILATIAGVMHSAPVLETADADLDRVMGINFKGTLYACQEAARAMIDRGTPGAIVTMASGAVDTGAPGLLCYGAAKAAVVQLTRTLATEVGPYGIRVNAVAPGWIRTPMTARESDSTDHHGGSGAGGTSGQEGGVRRLSEQRMVRASPLGRPGEAGEVAHTVLHLASDASAFTTGQILRPNGGVSMPW